MLSEFPFEKHDIFSIKMPGHSPVWYNIVYICEEVIDRYNVVHEYESFLKLAIANWKLSTKN